MRKFLFLGVLTLLLFSCKKETSGDLAIPTPVPSGKDPIIFVHGFLASGDTYEKQVKRFTSNGYSLADLYAFDWNSLGDRSVINRNLNTLVDSVLARTGKTKVHLVGHSAGTGVVQDYARAYGSKVKSLTLLAGFPPDRQDSIPILNIYSTFDFIATNGRDVAGGTNIKQT